MIKCCKSQKRQATEADTKRAEFQPGVIVQIDCNNGRNWFLPPSLAPTDAQQLPRACDLEPRAPAAAATIPIRVQAPGFFDRSSIAASRRDTVPFRVPPPAAALRATLVQLRVAGRQHPAEE